MSDLVNVNETLRAMLSPLEGTVQGKAVKFALHFLETGGKEIDRLRAELAELKSDVSDLDTMHVEAEFNVLESRDELAALTAKVERLEAENAELRANALDWKIVTEDPTTLPKGIGAVVLVLVGEEWWHQASLGSMGDDRRWRLASGRWERLSTGDRWAYILKPDEVPA